MWMSVSDRAVWRIQNTRLGLAFRVVVGVPFSGHGGLALVVVGISTLALGGASHC